MGCCFPASNAIDESKTLEQNKRASFRSGNNTFHKVNYGKPLQIANRFSCRA